MSKLIGPNPANQPVFASNNQTIQTVGNFQLSLDGKEYHLAKAGVANLAVGLIVQAPATVADHQNMSPANATLVTAFSKTITLTLGATAVAANQYAQGTLAVANGAGIAETYTIASHPAAIASANVVFTLEDALRTTANSVSRYSIVPNKYNGVILAPTTLTAVPVGVPVYPILAGETGYILTKGQGPGYGNGTFTIGQAVVPSVSNAGYISAAVLAAEAANTAETLHIVGSASSNGAAGHVSVIDYDF